MCPNTTRKINDLVAQTTQRKRQWLKEGMNHTKETDLISIDVALLYISCVLELYLQRFLMKLLLFI